MAISSVAFKKLRRIINEKCNEKFKVVLDEVLLACEGKQLLLAPCGDFTLTAYRSALDPLIGGRTIRTLSAKKIAMEENDDFFHSYNDPVASCEWNRTGNHPELGAEAMLDVIADSILDTEVVFSAIADSIEEAFGERVLLKISDSDSSTVSTVAAHMAASAFGQVLDQASGVEVFFRNPLAALREIVRFPPIAISDTEVIVLTQ